MKITQETNEFKPITIVLETREEAEELLEHLQSSRCAVFYCEELYKKLENT